jgi:ankyrin repeat protein
MFALRYNHVAQGIRKMCKIERRPCSIIERARKMILVKERIGKWIYCCLTIAILAGGRASADECEEFQLAVSKGELAKVTKMLSLNKSLVNQRSENKFTALFLAAMKDHFEIAELLIKHGAKLEDRAFGETPLYRACMDGSTSVVEVLLKHGAKSR